MQAAEKLFTSRRFHEITLEDVTREAGVGKGTVYRYFEDKDDLFFQTAMHGFEELCDLLEGSAGDNVAFPRQLLGACQQISRFFQRRGPLLRMMQGEELRMARCKTGLRREWHARRGRMVSALAKVLASGAAEGMVRRDIAPEVLAAFLMGMLRTHAREPELMDGPEALGLMVDLFLRGAGMDGQLSAAGEALTPAAAARGEGG